MEIARPWALIIAKEHLEKMTIFDTSTTPPRPIIYDASNRLAKALNVPCSTANSSVLRLVKLGVLKRVCKNVYELTDVEP